MIESDGKDRAHLDPVVRKAAICEWRTSPYKTRAIPWLSNTWSLPCACAHACMSSASSKMPSSPHLPSSSSAHRLTQYHLYREAKDQPEHPFSAPQML